PAEAVVEVEGERRPAGQEMHLACLQPRERRVVDGVTAHPWRELARILENLHRSAEAAVRSDDEVERQTGERLAESESRLLLSVRETRAPGDRVVEVEDVPQVRVIAGPEGVSGSTRGVLRSHQVGGGVPTLRGR